jgi:hypothetical protein
MWLISSASGDPAGGLVTGDGVAPGSLVGEAGAETVGAKVAVAGAVVAGTALAVAVRAGAEGDAVAVAGTTEGVVTLVGGTIVALGGAAMFVHAAMNRNNARNGIVRIAADATAPA